MVMMACWKQINYRIYGSICRYRSKRNRIHIFDIDEGKLIGRDIDGVMALVHSYYHLDEMHCGRTGWRCWIRTQEESVIISLRSWVDSATPLTWSTCFWEADYTFTRPVCQPFANRSWTVSWLLVNWELSFGSQTVNEQLTQLTQS